MEATDRFPIPCLAKQTGEPMAETFTVPSHLVPGHQVPGHQVPGQQPGNNLVQCISRSEAAKRLGISTRTLDRRTAPNGPIKPFRLGRRVLFSVAELDRYVAEYLAGQKEGEQ